jgi:hypothetical protein
LVGGQERALVGLVERPADGRSAACCGGLSDPFWSVEQQRGKGREQHVQFVVDHPSTVGVAKGIVNRHNPTLPVVSTGLKRSFPQV